MRDNNSCTLRVLEVILNLVELLMDMGVLKQCLRDELSGNSSSTPFQEPSTTSAKSTTKLPNSETQTSLGMELDKTTKPMTSHRLIMNTIIRY